MSPAQKQLFRFVILRHETPTGEHWDMMLETAAALTVWSIPPQSGLENFVCPAQRQPDHRKHYLDYEGNISGNRGTVSQIDAGTYETLDAQRFLLYGKLFWGTLQIGESACGLVCQFIRKP